MKRTLSAMIFAGLSLGTLALTMIFNAQPFSGYYDLASLSLLSVFICLWAYVKLGNKHDTHSGISLLNGTVLLGVIGSTTFFVANQDDIKIIGSALAMLLIVPLYGLLLRLALEPFHNQKEWGTSSASFSEEHLSQDLWTYGSSVGIALTVLTMITCLPKTSVPPSKVPSQSELSVPSETDSLTSDQLPSEVHN